MDGTTNDVDDDEGLSVRDGVDVVQSDSDRVDDDSQVGCAIDEATNSDMLK